MLPLMLYLSLGTNLAIMVPLCWMILRDHRTVRAVLGPDSPARRIAACLYGSIALLSLLGLYAWPTGHDETAMAVVLGVLPLQILTALLSALALSWRNPAVRLQLGLAALHAVTLNAAL